MTIPDIPRIFSAIVELGACLIYILPHRKALSGWRWVIITLLSLIVFIAYHLTVEQLPIQFWLPGMFGAAFLMYLFIRLTSDMNRTLSGYYTAFAFITAEFIQSLEWQIHTNLFSGDLSDVFFLSGAFALSFYAGGLTIIWYHSTKNSHLDVQFHVNSKQMWVAIITVTAAFLISNISFVHTDTPFSGRLPQEIFYIRTLVDFSALVVLFVLKEQHFQSQIKHELQSIQSILNRQYDQYEMSKESIEIVHRKYHDLKHQIDIIRAETDMSKKTEYINELEKGIMFYETFNKTGNHVLDTILNGKSLTCKKYEINMTCIANGHLLDFIDTMDICTIFGNALDNAIESVKQIEDVDKRLIRVAVFNQNNFLMIRFDNYFENKLNYEKGSLTTTKKNKDFHGYGIKSLRYTAERYNGSLTINTDDNWFRLCILIPLSESDYHTDNN